MAKEQRTKKEVKKAKANVTVTQTTSSSSKKEKEVAKFSGVMTCSPCKPGPAARYQDRRYGKNQRVYSVTKQNAASTVRQRRCTVCGATR